MRCSRRWATVSAALRADRVVGRRTRCEVSGRSVRKVSMMRSQMPRPTPLEEEVSGTGSRCGRDFGERPYWYLLAPVTSTKRVSWAGCEAQGAEAILTRFAKAVGAMLATAWMVVPSVSCSNC